MKFVPIEKQSKKKQREQNLRRRGTWGAINPVTRKAGKPNEYDRKKASIRKEDPFDSEPL